MWSWYFQLAVKATIPWPRLHLMQVNSLFSSICGFSCTSSLWYLVCFWNVASQRVPKSERGSARTDSVTNERMCAKARSRQLQQKNMVFTAGWSCFPSFRVSAHRKHCLYSYCCRRIRCSADVLPARRHGSGWFWWSNICASACVHSGSAGHSVRRQSEYTVNTGWRSDSVLVSPYLRCHYHRSSRPMVRPSAGMWTVKLEAMCSNIQVLSRCHWYCCRTHQMLCVTLSVPGTCTCLVARIWINCQHPLKTAPISIHFLSRCNDIWMLWYLRLNFYCCEYICAPGTICMVVDFRSALLMTFKVIFICQMSRHCSFLTYTSFFELWLMACLVTEVPNNCSPCLLHTIYCAALLGLAI